MREKWYAFGPMDSPTLLRSLRARYPGAAIVMESDPGRLRSRLLAEPVGKAGVVVGNAGSMDAVNLAAALVADGHAKEVILLATCPSGSLRSRAATAGIHQVLSEQEFVSGDSYADLDEPVWQPEAPAAQTMEDTRPADASQADVLATDDEAQEEPRVQAKGQLSLVLDDVTESCTEAIAKVQLRAEKPEGACPILCIASGRGGVGKTAIAATMASLAAGWGMRVGLIDLDLGCGNLFSCFNLGGPADVSTLASLETLTRQDVEAIGQQVDENIDLWGPCARPELAETLEWRVGEMIARVSESHDLVICDCSTTFTDAVAQAAQMTDRLLLVADDMSVSPGSLSRTALLAVRLGVARTRITRVMNRCDVRAGGQNVSYRGAAGLETARAFKLYEGDEDMPDLLGEGRVADLVKREDDFVRSAAGCLASLLSELGALPDNEDARYAADHVNEPVKRGFFARMRKAG